LRIKEQETRLTLQEHDDDDDDDIPLSHDKLVPVTMAWRVIGLRMEERPPMWAVTANIVNKQSRAADKVWSSRLGDGRGANNSSPYKHIMLRIVHEGLGPGLIFWYYLSMNMRFCIWNVRSLYRAGSLSSQGIGKVYIRFSGRHRCRWEDDIRMVIQ